MKLSVVVIAHNMAREIPRTLQSLTKSYQIGLEDTEYEVLIIENGSRDRLDKRVVEDFGPEFQYYYLKDPPASPAYALNYGAKLANGDILCFMIDGAHLLTPGVLRYALSAFRAFKNPVVMTRYFYLGPGQQNESILKGYDKVQEDELLKKIGWPREGYRLFEIGTPLLLFGKDGKTSWFNRMSESNCLFMYRSVFNDIGGADERFDMPGGGFLNIDLCLGAIDLPGTEPVLLIGEGSFHQLHGGLTTNVSPQDRDFKVQGYLLQYQEIKKRIPRMNDKDTSYIGHLPTLQSKIHLKTFKKMVIT